MKTLIGVVQVELVQLVKVQANVSGEVANGHKAEGVFIIFQLCENALVVDVVEPHHIAHIFIPKVSSPDLISQATVGELPLSFDQYFGKDHQVGKGIVSSGVASFFQIKTCLNRVLIIHDQIMIDASVDPEVVEGIVLHPAGGAVEAIKIAVQRRDVVLTSGGYRKLRFDFNRVLASAN